MRTAVQSAYPAGYVPKPVPTVAELAKRGMARPVQHTVVAPDGSTRQDTRMHVTPEGHALMGEVMADNAAAWRKAAGK